LSFFNNVPETNLSTLEDSGGNEEAAGAMELGLKWEKGIAKLPGSDIQVKGVQMKR